MFTLLLLPNRVVTRDNAEYLFVTDSEDVLEEWVTKLSFHANLPPSMQLMSYDNHKVSDGLATWNVGLRNGSLLDSMSLFAFYFFLIGVNCTHYIFLGSSCHCLWAKYANTVCSFAVRVAR